MPRERALRIHPDLRVADLKRRHQSAARLMNVKVPAEIGDAVEELAAALGVTKTEVVIALLNHGLEVASKALRDVRPGGESPTRRSRRARTGQS